MQPQSLPGIFDAAYRDPATTAVVRPWRLTRATTKAAWYAVRGQLTEHEQAVFWGLLAYWNRHQAWPTAYELFEFLRACRARTPRHPRYRLIHDINNVRPRLTGMNQRDPAIVVTGPARVCTSQRAREAGSTLEVLTWRAPQVGEPLRRGRPAA
jgi:hypothetical protein